MSTIFRLAVIIKKGYPDPGNYVNALGILGAERNEWLLLPAKIDLRGCRNLMISGVDSGERIGLVDCWRLFGYQLFGKNCLGSIHTW